MAVRGGQVHVQHAVVTGMEGNDGAADVTPSEDDDVLREQSFKRPQGLNLDSVSYTHLTLPTIYSV